MFHAETLCQLLFRLLGSTKIGGLLFFKNLVPSLFSSVSEREGMLPVGGVSPGTVALYYNGGALRAMKAAELFLRCAITLFGVLTAALIGSNTQTRDFFSQEKKAEFTDMKALVFLVATSGAVAGYSLIHGVRCAWSMVVKGSAVLLNKPLAWAIFSLDQAVAYLTLAAVSAAVQGSALGKFGQPELQWMKICDLYAKFCKRGEEGLVCAVLVCLCVVTVSSISAFNLFRLYGEEAKGSKSGRTASW
ncbi:CASP-like protein 2B1 [Zingiber officinale]|uniref:CASP-like protein 2B1 n=1 Tax=Zingiber officinale TaxID=94328 RepID=UPI001C4D5840|nr:CASP-like protein 2B1 [Zingiber officinale]